MARKLGRNICDLQEWAANLDSSSIPSFQVMPWTHIPHRLASRPGYIQRYNWVTLGFVNRIALVSNVSRNHMLSLSPIYW